MPCVCNDRASVETGLKPVSADNTIFISLLLTFYMNYATEKLNSLFSIILLVFSVYFIYYIFFLQYEKGYEAGKFTPPQEKKIVSREINMRALAVSTDEVITKGSGLYQTNCASCHGQTGKGDGPKAERLNPKPRNYGNKTAFRNGTTVLNLFQTVTNGIPGTSMPSFDLLPVDHRFAIVHFIRTLIPDPNSDTPEAIAALPGSGDVSQVAATETSTGARIPISLAIEKILKESERKK